MSSRFQVWVSSDVSASRSLGQLYLCSRLPTIWVMVKYFLENQLGLLVMMNWAGRCQRFGQKELRALSGSILVDFFNFPHYWPITVHLTLLLLAVSPWESPLGQQQHWLVRQCLDLLLLEPNDLQFIPILYKLLRGTDLQRSFHTKASYTKTGFQTLKKMRKLIPRLWYHDLEVTKTL